MLKQLIPLALAALVAAQDAPADLATTLSNTPELANLTSLLQGQPDLVEALSSAQDITILAPSNDAFAALLATEEGQAVAADPAAVAALLTYHVLNGTFFGADITETPAFVKTLLADNQYTNVTGGQNLQAAVEDGNVVFTSGLLQKSTVSTADVNFTGGVVHIIDTVLTIPALTSETALAANLTALYGALGATELVSAVDETPDLTIFAPTNEAFEKIAAALANASTEDIASVLQYHVVAGTVAFSTGLENGAQIETLNGESITVTVEEDGDVFVNGAKVIVPNVLVANGVVHVIDNVLNPAATDAPEPSATAGVPAFPTTGTATGVPFTSGVPAPTQTVGEGATGTTSLPESTGAADALKGSMGAAALFAGAALLF